MPYRGQSVFAEPGFAKVRTVKVVSCGPDVAKGRCPNLGFFLCLGAEDMVALVRGANVRFNGRYGRCRILKGIRAGFRSRPICTSSHEPLVILSGELQLQNSRRVRLHLRHDDVAGVLSIASGPSSAATPRASQTSIYKDVCKNLQKIGDECKADEHRQGQEAHGTIAAAAKLGSA